MGGWDYKSTNSNNDQLVNITDPLTIVFEE
jgi:hypothetical protein